MGTGKLITEEERRRIARDRTYTERFDLLMKLIRISRMLKGARIVKPAR